MTEFAAYFDDGGHPVNQVVVIAAGFISTEAHWLVFEKEWKAKLASIGLTTFHRTDFESSPKWSRNEKDRLIEGLISVIKRRTLFHISHTVIMQDYKEVNEERAFEEVIGSPFALAGRTVARSINDWKRKHFAPNDKLIVMFEDGTLHKGDFMEVMKRDELPCPQFIAKIPPLEAADLLAWEVLSAFKLHRLSPILEDFMRTHPGDDGTYTKNDLLTIATSAPMPSPLRSSISPDAKFYSRASPKRPRRRTVF